MNRQLKQQLKKTNGFTLIEILIASVILFSSLAVVSMIYRGAFISSEKANNHISLVGVLPSILANVRQEIRSKGNSSVSELSQQGVAWDIQYKWQAHLIEHKSAPEIFDVDFGDFLKPPKKYKLWNIDLTLERNGLSKHYQLNELSWSND
jgi:type II secretory pathway component PulJ